MVVFSKGVAVEEIFKKDGWGKEFSNAEKISLLKTHSARLSWAVAPTYGLSQYERWLREDKVQALYDHTTGRMSFTAKESFGKPFPDKTRTLHL
jgi:hypothetical protein